MDYLSEQMKMRKEMKTRVVLNSLIKVYQKLINSGYNPITAKRKILEIYPQDVFTIYMEVE